MGKSSKRVINENLSEREIEVLKTSVEFKSVEDIGKKLYITGNSVKTHLTNIYQKLHSHSRLSAVIKALKLGIITLDDLEV